MATIIRVKLCYYCHGSISPDLVLPCHWRCVLSFTVRSAYLCSDRVRAFCCSNVSRVTRSSSSAGSPSFDAAQVSAAMAGTDQEVESGGGVVKGERKGGVCGSREKKVEGAAEDEEYSDDSEGEEDEEYTGDSGSDEEDEEWDDEEAQTGRTQPASKPGTHLFHVDSMFLTFSHVCPPASVKQSRAGEAEPLTSEKARVR